MVHFYYISLSPVYDFALSIYCQLATSYSPHKQCIIKAVTYVIVRIHTYQYICNPLSKTLSLFTRVAKLRRGLREQCNRADPNEKLSNSNGTFVLLMLIFNSPSDSPLLTRLLVGRLSIACLFVMGLQCPVEFCLSSLR